MKKVLWGLSCLAFSCAAFATDITIINYANYMPKSIMQNYETETGNRIVQTFYAGNDMLKGMLMAGDTQYDLAVPALVDMEQEIPAHLYQPLNKALIPNLKNVDPTLYAIAARIDPGNKYGIIYSYGTTGIAYNIDMIHKILGKNVKIDSWKYLFDPKYLSKLSKCGVSFLDDPTEVFGITLFYLGLNPNSHNPADYAKATHYLMGIRQYLTYFDESVYMQDMASGNLCMAMAYSGDTLRMIEAANASHNGVHIAFASPKEGAPIWFDMMIVPAHAANPTQAMKFLNYLLEPKVMAKVSNYVGQPNAVLGSKAYMNPEINSPEFTPPPEITKTLFSLHNPILSMSTLVSDYWFEVRYGIKMN